MSIKSRKKLYLIGAGGCGREVAAWVHDIPESERDWDLAGFLDSRDSLDLVKYKCHVPIYGDPATWDIQPNHCFALSMGESKDRRFYYTLLKLRGAQFVNLIHPSVEFWGEPCMGEANIFNPQGRLTVNITVGNGALIHGSGTVGHDVAMGDFVSVGPITAIGGNVTIDNDVWIAPHVAIRSHVHIGTGARIGLGSVVIKSVAPGQTVFGNPAKVIKQN